jgi:DNA-binding response OmpR family regulator
MSSRILLIEDEPGLVLALSDLLSHHGYQVETATDGEAGLSVASSGGFHLVILDAMLPRRDGFSVLEALRERGADTPVLMLTARTQVPDRIRGLKLGADDYLGKPFDPSELLARVEAILRRVKPEGAPVGVVRFGDVEVDFDHAVATKQGAPVSLATKELQLLQYLVERAGRIVPREEILQAVWEYQSEVSSRTVDVHLSWLRQKLEDNPQTPRHLHTIRGKGYRFSP